MKIQLDEHEIVSAALINLLKKDDINGCYSICIASILATIECVNLDSTPFNTQEELLEDFINDLRMIAKETKGVLHA